MKTKDFVLAAVISVNLVLLVLVGGLAAARTEPVAQAGSAVDEGGFIQMSTVRITDSREGVAVIDRLSNKLNFYTPVVGRKEFEKKGSPIDLSIAFKHPK